jgi:hypothetical protein
MLESAGNEVAIFSGAHEQNIPSLFSGYFLPEIHTERPKLSARALGTVKS